MKIGDVIEGRYVVERALGEGGMAWVFQVKHLALGSTHALKVLKPEFAIQSNVRARLAAEGQIQARLRHPNIVAVTEVVAQPDIHGLIMEFIDGPSMADFIRQLHHPPQSDLVKRLFTQILDAVGFAHAKGIIHRDIKPENILLARDSKGRLVPKITDFGIAKIQQATKREGTRTGISMGTNGYMSPEQILNSKEVTPQSDIYSLGATLYELATLRPAFGGASEYEVMDRIIHERYVPPQSVWPGLDSNIAQSISRALHQEAARRFESCEVFVGALGPPEKETWPQVDRGVKVDKPAPATQHGQRKTVFDILPTRGNPVSYSAPINRANPTCIVLLLDQSKSMEDPFGGATTGTKCQGLADVTNRMLQNLMIRCAREDGIRDYFHIAVIGYNGANVGPVLGGSLVNQELLPISQIGSAPLRLEERKKKVDDGAGGVYEQVVKFPIWIEPVANGGTPMSAALKSATNIVQRWLSGHPDCFPPIVINITDGEPNDGDPLPAANTLKQLRSSDGEVLLLNLHLSSSRAPPVRFPDSETTLQDQFATMLFRMSSTLTPGMQSAAVQLGYPAGSGSKGFVFNGDLSDLVQFLDIGTRVSELR